MRHGPHRHAARLEQEGVAPDIIAMAKGLGGGYLPIGAVLVDAPSSSRVEAARGAFMHGHTYMGTRWPAPRRSPCSR